MVAGCFLFDSVRAIHRRVDLRHFHPLRSGKTTAQTLSCRCRILINSRMASGGMQDSAALMQTMTLLNGESFEILPAAGISKPDFRNAIDSALFKQWLKNMQSESGLLAGGQMHLQRVEVQGVDMFGNRIGFLKFKAEVFNKQTGIKVPGIVFARGPSVAVLILLESDNDTYVVLTEQESLSPRKLIWVRVPVGKLILELPAGMVDDEGGDLVGIAVREVEEETGINLNVKDMVDLTAFLNPKTGCKVFSSPGGCDEELSLFLYKGRVNKESIEGLKGKEKGLHDHGEFIKVRIIPYHELWRATADAKALIAVALYEMAKRDDLLSRQNA